MCEIFEPYNSRSAQVACDASIKHKMTEKTAREFMRARQKRPIWWVNCKGQENIIKSANKFMVK